MSRRKASIKETGEELSQEEWARFDAAVAKIQSERPRSGYAMTAAPTADEPAACRTPARDHRRETTGA